MQWHTWFVYVTVSLVAIISPGPAVLLAINNAIVYDLKATAFSTLGNALGLFILSGAAMLGLGLVLQTSLVLFTLFKIAGALYLIYLGLKQFRAKHNIFERVHLTPLKNKTHYFAVFRKGLFVAVTNPKPIIFFTALFPLFLNPEQAIMPQFFILTLTFIVLSYATLMSYAFFAGTLKGWFSTKNRAVWFHRISGAIFVGLGVGLLGFERK